MTVLAVDTSVIVALLKGEPTWEQLATCLQGASSRFLSAASWVELSLVIAGRDGNEAKLNALD